MGKSHEMLSRVALWARERGERKVYEESLLEIDFPCRYHEIARIFKSKDISTSRGYDDESFDI